MGNKYGYKSGRKKAIVTVVVILLIAALGCAVYAFIYNQNALREDAMNGMKSEIASNGTVSSLIALTANDDFDGDGVKNSEENSAKTDPTRDDSDNDGLNDAEELSLGTDPNKADTDGDGILDGFEVKAGLDPLLAKSNGSEPDGNIRFENSLTKDSLTVKVTGDANCYDFNIHTANIVALTSNPYIVSGIYDINCRYTFDSASITFKLDTEKLKTLELNNSQLTIYNYNTVSKMLEPVESTVTGDTITATVSHFSIYCVGVKSLATEALSTQILFVIDNSGSMYPVEMCIESEENDVDFKRLDMVRGIIENLGTEEYSYRISKFTASYDSMHTNAAFSSDKAELEGIIDRIRNEFPYFDGTNISNCIDRAVSEFNASGADGHRIIVLLTDGDGTENNPYTAEEITKIVTDSGAVLLTIGLGTQVDAKYLADMAEGTGGMYYTASNAGSLARVCSDISAMLSDAVVLPEGTLNGTDGNDYMEGYVVADSGFGMIDAFSFCDYPTIDANSSSLGIAAFASAYYSRSLSPTQQGTGSADGYDLINSELWNNFTSDKPLSEFKTRAFGGYIGTASKLDFNKADSIVPVVSNLRTASQNEGFYIKTMSFTKRYLDSITAWETIAAPIDASGKITTDVFKSKYPCESAMMQAISWYERNAESGTRYTDISVNRGEAGFEKVIEAVRNGEPVIASLYAPDGERQISRSSVNIMSIMKCPKNEYDYYLCVYDSKTPDSEQWIKLRVTRRNERGASGSEYTLSADYSNGITEYVNAGIGFLIEK